MKYIITETQLGKVVKRYLNSLGLSVTRKDDDEIWIENQEGKAVFYYYREKHETTLMIDPEIWSTVMGLFGLDDMSARVEILYWFEDKFDKRVDKAYIWWD